MSKKSSLSNEGATAACLSFASQLLVSELSLHQLSTKDALAPIVLEAHRIGQQIQKLFVGMDSSNTTDPRSLLKYLQAHRQDIPNENDSSIAALDMLKIADLSWDFQGIVAQTLEMELQELVDRVRELEIGACVLFSIHSQVNTIEYGLIWLPSENNVHPGSDSRHASKRKQHFLLYICPGRVKVVKTLSDLVKKMQEEMKMMKERDSQYTVWTLLRNLRPQELSDRVNSSINVFTTTEFGEINTSSCIVNDTCLVSDPVTAQNEIKKSVKPIHITCAEKKRPTTSMFTFYNEPFEASLPQENITAYTRDEPIPVGSEMAMESMSSRPEAQMPSPELDRMSRLKPAYRREFVSTSLPTHHKKTVHTSTMSNWRSIDSDLKNHELESATVNFESFSNQLHDMKGQYYIRQQVAESLHQAVTSSSTTITEANASSIVTHEDRDCESTLASLEPAEIEPQCDVSEPVLTVSSSDPTRSHDYSENIRNPDSINTAIDEVIETNTSEEATNTNDPPTKAALTHTLQKKKFKNFKSKLGAQVWWELEYTARALEQQNESPKRSLHCQQVVATQYKTTARAFTAPTSITNPVFDQQSEKTRKVEESETEEFCIRNELDNVLPPSNIRDDLGFDSLLNRNADQEEIADNQSIEMLFTQSRKSYHHLDEASPVPPRQQVELGQESINKDQTTAVTRLKAWHASLLPDNEIITSSPMENQLESFHDASVIADGLRGSKVVSRHKLIEETLFAEPDRSLLSMNSDPDKRLELDNRQSKTRDDRLQRVRAGSSKSIKKKQLNRPWYAKDEDEISDDEVSQIQWTQTVRYDDQISTDARPEQPSVSPKIPFNLQGRVPIRPQKEVLTSTLISVSNNECNNQSEDSTERAFTHRTSKCCAETKEDFSPDVEVQKSISNYGSIEQTTKTKPPPAEFVMINVEGPNAAIAAKSALNTISREEKLAELRRKKLKQLQKAREESLQMQKQKHNTHKGYGVSSDHMGPMSITSQLKAKRPSNRQLIQNALEFTLLAGGSFEKERLAALHALTQSDTENFIVLLKSSKEVKFRALYEVHLDRQNATKIYSLVPNTPHTLTTEIISRFFKYNSGKKEFLSVETRSFTVTTDACALIDQLVFKKKTNLAKIL